MSYASRLRAKLDPKHPCNQSFNQPKLSAGAFERIREEEFQQKMYGGFKKNNKCPDCNMLRAANGICDCSVL